MVTVTHAPYIPLDLEPYSQGSAFLIIIAHEIIPNNLRFILFRAVVCQPGLTHGVKLCIMTD